jgi:hypothetical protein
METLLRKIRWSGVVLAALVVMACGGGATSPVRPQLAQGTPRALSSAASATPTITHGDLFTWAAVAFPQFFPGTPAAGRFQQYDYRKYTSGNFLAVDDDEVIWVMGPSFGSTPMYIGPVAQFAPQVLAWQATQPRTAYRGKVLISLWNADGSVGSIQDFVNFTHYTINRWSMYSNYGLYALGKPAAGAQIGSDISQQNVDGTNYVVMDIPKNQTFYFTALWKAATIGTVFMRTDAQGSGHLIDSDQPRKLELPYDFARDEFQQAQRQLADAALTPQAQALLDQATTAMNTANNAATPSARAVAAYAALSYVIPLKERLAIDASNQVTRATGRRSDFDMNYEGFGSWTDTANAPTYAAAKQAGFGSVYTAVDWKRISPSPGVYDFSSLDYLIAQAHSKGFQISMNINQNLATKPAWAANLDFEALKTLYYEHARMVVARYGSQVLQYYPAGELELQLGGFTQEQVAELARQSLNGARAASPARPFGYYVSASAYVGYQMNPTSTPDYMSGLDLIAYMKRNGISYDFIGLEMQYGTTFAPIDLQRFQEVVQQVYQVAQVPIYMGETGASSMTEDYGIVSQFHWHDGLTRQSQYEWADGTLRMLYAMPYVKGYYWVHLDADNNDYGSDYLSTLVGTGLVAANGTVKKVQSAFVDFFARFP